MEARTGRQTRSLVRGVGVGGVVGVVVKGVFGRVVPDRGWGGCFFKGSAQGQGGRVQRGGPGIGVEASRGGRADGAVDFHGLEVFVLQRLGDGDEPQLDLEGLLDAVAEETHDVLTDAAGDHRL